MKFISRVTIIYKVAYQWRVISSDSWATRYRWIKSNESIFSIKFLDYTFLFLYPEVNLFLDSAMNDKPEQKNYLISSSILLAHKFCEFCSCFHNNFNLSTKLCSINQQYIYIYTHMFMSALNSHSDCARFYFTSDLFWQIKKTFFSSVTAADFMCRN